MPLQAHLFCSVRAAKPKRQTLSPRRRRLLGLCTTPREVRYNIKQLRPASLVAVSSSHSEYLAVAEQKVNANDMLGALTQFELALDSEDVPTEVRKKLLFNCVSVHARFGDLELAQIPLRKAVLMGLDFEQAVAASQVEPGMVPMKAPRQVMISLKRFAQTCQDSVKADRPAHNPTKGLQLTPAGVQTAFAQEDIQDLVGTEMKGADMDKSLGGILKRVALLLFILAFGGVCIFYLGLRLAFPDGI